MFPTNPWLGGDWFQSVNIYLRGLTDGLGSLWENHILIRESIAVSRSCSSMRGSVAWMFSSDHIYILVRE